MCVCVWGGGCQPWAHVLPAMVPYRRQHTKQHRTSNIKVWALLATVIQKQQQRTQKQHRRAVRHTGLVQRVEQSTDLLINVTDRREVLQPQRGDFRSMKRHLQALNRHLRTLMEANRTRAGRVGWVCCGWHCTAAVGERSVVLGLELGRVVPREMGLDKAVCDEKRLTERGGVVNPLDRDVRVVDVIVYTCSDRTSVQM